MISPGTCSSSQLTSSGSSPGEPRVGGRARRRCRSARARASLADRMAVAAAALDSRVDGDPGAHRALLDRLKQRQRRRHTERGQCGVERQGAAAPGRGTREPACHRRCVPGAARRRARAARAPSPVNGNTTRVGEAVESLGRAAIALAHQRASRETHDERRGEGHDQRDHASRSPGAGCDRRRSARRRRAARAGSGTAARIGLRQPLPGAALGRCAHQDVGSSVPRSRRDPFDHVDHRRPLLPRVHVPRAPRRGGEPRQARGLLSAQAAAPSGLDDPQQVELGAKPLRRAPGAPHDPLGLRREGDQRQQPLADGLRGGGLGEQRSSRADPRLRRGA